MGTSPTVSFGRHQINANPLPINPFRFNPNHPRPYPCPHHSHTKLIPHKKSTCFLEETMIPNYHRLESILSMISFLHHSHKGHCPATVLANDRRTSIVIMYANAIAECNGRCNELNIILLMTGALDTTHPPRAPGQLDKVFLSNLSHGAAII